MEKQIVIEVKNVNKSYGGNRVLRNVSFTVKPGIHGFIGPNGAGKTTTLGIIVRLVVPNSGEVRVEGKLVANDPSFNEHLGFVPAEPLFPPITVENYVLDCGYLRDIPKSEVLAKLNSSPLSAHRYKKCHELSTGWKKILQVFVLSLYRPKVFILDEPFNGLDPTFRKDLFDNLISIKKQGGTILISTHILSDLQKLADEITMIREGEIVYSGPKTGDIEETYEEYFVKKKTRNVWIINWENMTTKKLFWYYLKKLLWRSWRVWIIILFSWVWWLVLSLGLSGALMSMGKNKDSKEEKESLLFFHKQLYRGYMLRSEGTIEWMKENIDKLEYTSANKEKIKKRLEEWEKEYEGLSYEEREKKARKDSESKEVESWYEGFIGKIDVEKESKEERWKRRYSYWGVLENVGLVFRSPYDYNLVEFASPRGWKELSTYQMWGLINNISIWNFAGFMIGGFFVYTLIDKLFFDTKKNGEDAMVVSFTPGVQRGQIFFGKVLAYITTLAVFVLLGCVLPYGVLIGISTGLTFFPWLNFLWLALYSTIIGSLCFTLIAGGFYLFFNTLGSFGRVLQWLMSYLPLITVSFMFIKWKMFNQALAQIQYWYYHPVVHLGLAAGLGFLLFSLYLSYYKQEDLD